MSTLTCYDSNGNVLSELYQWDVNRTVVIGGADIMKNTAIHFCNRRHSRALVVPATVSGADITAPIPNILLQDAEVLVIYIYQESEDGEQKTAETLLIPVRPREKPEDYTYTENIEYANWVKLEQQAIALLEELNGAEERIAESVYNRLTVDTLKLVGKLTEDGGEIFNDYENNQAISNNTHAEGQETHSGIKGYPIAPIASTDTVPLTITVNDANFTEKAVDMYAVGDILQFDASQHYYNRLKITDLSTNDSGQTVIEVEDLMPTATAVDLALDSDPNENYVWVVDKNYGEVFPMAYGSHAEGELTKAMGRAAHAEGRQSQAVGAYAHAEGRATIANYLAHAEGHTTTASGNYSHAEGHKSVASGAASHAEGVETKAVGTRSHAEGYLTTANFMAHAEGSGTEATGQASHAEGFKTKTVGEYSHAEGRQTQAIGNHSHAEGLASKAEGGNSHAEGSGTTSSGTAAHAEGMSTVASGLGSHAEGYQTYSEGDYSHSEGRETKTQGWHSHAEGFKTFAIGINSHTEGNETKAHKPNSHAEGYRTEAQGDRSHAEGYVTKAVGSDSHAEGFCTIVNSASGHVQGKYNIEDTEKKFAHIIGGGTSNTDRKNIHTVDWSGNAWYSGKVTAGVDPTEDMDLTTKKYVHANFAPADFGYLGKAETDDTWKTLIENCLSQMPADSVRQASVMNGGRWSVTIHKHLEGYATVTEDTYWHMYPGNATYHKRVRSLYNGVWGEWEWANPPLITSHEYRTTERYNGKAVYAQLVDFGTLPNKAPASVQVITSRLPVTDIVSYEVLVKTPNPYVNHRDMVIDMDNGYMDICMNTEYDESNTTAKVLIKYTLN